MDKSIATKIMIFIWRECQGILKTDVCGNHAWGVDVLSSLVVASYLIDLSKDNNFNLQSACNIAICS